MVIGAPFFVPADADAARAGSKRVELEIAASSTRLNALAKRGPGRMALRDGAMP